MTATTNVLKRFSLGRYTGVVIGLALVCVYLSVTEPAFLTWGNITNIIKANTVMFILAIGMTFVLLTGMIDLSIASATAACVMVLGLMMDAGWAWQLAIVLTLAFGVFLGFINGFLSSVAKISFLVVTLGTLSIYQSFALLVTDGDPIPLFGLEAIDAIRALVNDDIGPIPVLLVVWAILFALAAGTLRYTSFGRAVFAVGSNPEASRLAGINVTRVLVTVFIISGLCAALAAVVQVGRLTGSNPQADPTLLLAVIAAVLIGGTSYTGGDGGVLGTLIGVVFLAVVQNGLTLSDVSTFWQGTVAGVILIAAVGLGVLRGQGWRFGRRRVTPETIGSGGGGPNPGRGDST